MITAPSQLTHLSRPRMIALAVGGVLVWLLTSALLFRLCGWPAIVIMTPAGVLSLYTIHLMRMRRQYISTHRHLEESERLLNTIVDALPMFLYRCRNDTDWTMEFISPGCAAITGYTPEDLIMNHNASYGKLIRADHRDEVWRRCQNAIANRIPVELEYPIHTASGEERWMWERGHGVFDAKSRVICWEGLIIDITDRKQAELERNRLLDEADKTRRVLLSVLDDERRGQAERARLASAIEQAGESIMISNTDGIIQYVNPAFTTSSGYTREEAIGQHTRIIKSGQQNDVFYKDMWETISRGDVWTGRITNRKKNGELYVEDATISPVNDHNGQVINFVAVKRDITHELQIEQQLLQSQKMEVVGQMAGGIAHDFNNNLQTIMGFTDLALEELTTDTRIREYLMEVRKASESASTLTRQLLAFSRRQMLAKRNTDINQLVEHMSKMITRLIGENIALDLSPSATEPRVNADAGQIEQVILNLAVNARDAMPKGGRLSISISNIDYTEQDLTDHPNARPGHFVRIAVTDTGVGIPPAMQAKIFEPFFTTKPSGKGTGLGLSTVYGIVRQHDGWITLYSEMNSGSDFHIYLPVSADAPATISIKPDADQDLKGRNERLLVVEDEIGIRQLMERILTSSGYRVSSAASAEEAYEIYQAEKGAFDLIISDVVLPQRSGFDLVEDLKKLNRSLRVLMVSGYTDERTRWPQIREKGWRYLQKPVGRKVLLATLREILADNRK